MSGEILSCSKVGYCFLIYTQEFNENKKTKACPEDIKCYLLSVDLFSSFMHFARMSKDPKKIFGTHIRDLSKKINLSQEALASKCKLHRTYVGAIERGERNVSLLNIVNLGRALRVKPAELFKGIL